MEIGLVRREIIESRFHRQSHRTYPVDLLAGNVQSPVGRAPPYIIYGNVVVEAGPIIGHDQLIAYLIARHGHLKKASMDIIDGSSRGPPNKTAFLDRPAVKIYIVGTIAPFRGPNQMGNSLLRASIVDLGPTEQQFETFAKESERRQDAAWAAIEARMNEHPWYPKDPVFGDQRYEPPRYEPPKYEPIEVP